MKNKLILASASPRRLGLLAQLRVTPDQVIAAEIDETPRKHERPRALALRLAEEKARAVAVTYPDHFILAADTVVARKRNILPKAEKRKEAEECLKQLSGHWHHVYGGICLIVPGGKATTRLCYTLVRFKILSESDIHFYVRTAEWQGKAGGYAIQGFAGSFVKYMRGSYSNVVGLSLYDTMKMLHGAGYATDIDENGSGHTDRGT